MNPVFQSIIAFVILFALLFFILAIYQKGFSDITKILKLDFRGISKWEFITNLIISLVLSILLTYSAVY